MCLILFYPVFIVRFLRVVMACVFDPLLPCVYSEVPSGGNGMCV